MSRKVDYRLNKRNQQMLWDFWDLGTLQKVGDKYSMTRERVRQIYERMGENVVEIRQAKKDYFEYLRIESEYGVCKGCGNNHKISVIRLKRKRLPEYCHKCFIKRRSKLDGYIFQKKWFRENKDKVRVYARKAARKYQITHREEINARHRKRYAENPEFYRKKYLEYYYANKEHLIEYRSQRRIKSLLDE